MMIELQLKLLADKMRNRAFYEAFKKIIRRGETVVCDIGSGTGFLSFLASKLGAKKCVLYEYSDLIELSRDTAGLNDIQNCEFIQKHSAQAKNGPLVDVLVSETLGNFALEENIIENIENAKRFLKPMGTILPCALSQFAAPVVSSRIFKKIDIFEQIGFDIDFSPVRQAALNNMFVYKIEPADLMTGKNISQKWDEINFYKKNKSLRQGVCKWQIEKDTTVYGFAVWWEAILVPGIKISTSPFEPKTHWDQIFLPLLEPLKCKKNDSIALTLKSDSRYEVGVRVEWKASLKRAGKTIEKVEMDTEKGCC